MACAATPSAKVSADDAVGSNGYFISRFATVAAIATFLVVAGTGILLFSHIGDRFLRTAHEWLGMAFVVAAILHVIRHSGPFARLMKQPRTLLAIGLAIVAAVLLVTMTAGSSGSHGRRSLHGEVIPTPEVARQGVG
jgi:drug/metabolite transporter (DMT)-like permease